MKNFFKKTWAFLCKTWVWTLLVVVIASLLVWFAGPLFAVDDYKFWEPATARLLTISAFCLLWGLLMVFVSWRSTVRKKAVEDSEVGQARLQREAQIDTAQKELRSRFKDALHTLKTSSLYRGRSERWRTELPWYLVIGPQGSGKTSLLDFSGLEFPINKIERKLTRDTKGTQHCDWYFADNGVLIDTAGRYLTHDDKQVDEDAWQTLLGLLRKRRRNRPLNGVLVNIPLEVLQSNSEADLDQLGSRIRARLQEIQQQLHVNVPVYLVISKADQVVGFNEFFDQLTREETEQVLGASFRKGQKGSDASVVRQEFEAVLSRLDSQVIMRMHQERDPQRRGLILDFPQQLAKIGEHLCVLVDMAFTGNRYQRASELRGFYFTSAPHATEAMDESTAAIGANLGMSSRVIPTMRVGRARFIHHLFSRVIFPEADLAGLDKREVSRINWGQRALYVAALLLMGVFGLAWANSFSANHDRLEQVRDIAQKLDGQRGRLNPQDDGLAALATLDSSYAASRVFPAKGDVSLQERGGLYQGEPSDPVLKAAYQRDLENVLLPRVARMLEAQIRGSMGNRDQLLGSLRAYLMLNLTERRDPATLKDVVATGWAQAYPGNADVQNSLNDHFARLLKQPFVYGLNDPLVAQARQVLRSESLAAVVYRVLREQARDLPDYRLSQHLGPQGSVFIGTDYVIPGFYTQNGYQQYFITQGANMVRDILRDNWVLGEGGNLSTVDLRQLMVELEQLYFHDYANYWSDAVAGIELEATNNASEGADQVGSLTSANSPLLQLLTEIRQNTRFPAPLDDADVSAVADKAAGKLGKVAKAAASAADQAQNALAKSLPDTARKSLERRFEPLHRLLDDNSGPAADLTPALQALNDLQQQLASLARSSQPEQAAYDMAKNRMGGQRDALNNLRNAASRLPVPVKGWFNGLAEDTWSLVLDGSYQYVNQHYQAELYGFYKKAISERYPFFAHSDSDVALNDFREFFKAQGIADQFFDNYLRPFVSGEPGNYRLRAVDGRSLPMSKVFLDQMTNAQVIRRSFFSENPNEPQVQFKLEPYTLDSNVGTADFRFGDQHMIYRHGPIVPVAFKWPAQADDGRTSLVLEPLGGRPLGIEKNTGPWSLFRLFDLMQTEYQSGRDVLMVKADVGGMRANYLVLSQRSPNPFDMTAMRSFRMPAAL